MKNGKLNSDDLRDLLKTYTGFKREEVISSGKLGEDCTFIEIGKEVIALSTDPVTAAANNIGKIAFNINLNDISTSGSTAIGILVTLLLPEGSTYNYVKQIMDEIHEECVKNEISILGGHTEITDAVKRSIVSITIIGKNKIDGIIRTSNIELGDDLVISKDLCIEGTYIIANDFKEKLVGILTEDDFKNINKLENKLSVRLEGLAGKKAKVNMMHDITEGGILGAIHEVCEGNNLGCKIYKEKLPLMSVTTKVCDALDVDPYRLISSGSMLFSTKDYKVLKEELDKFNIKSTVIGKVTKEKIIIIDGNGNEKEITAPKRDELYRLYENE